MNNERSALSFINLKWLLCFMNTGDEILLLDEKRWQPVYVQKRLNGQLRRIQLLIILISMKAKILFCKVLKIKYQTLRIMWLNNRNRINKLMADCMFYKIQKEWMKSYICRSETLFQLWGTFQSRVSVRLYCEKLMHLGEFLVTHEVSWNKCEKGHGWCCFCRNIVWLCFNAINDIWMISEHFICKIFKQ